MSSSIQQAPGSGEEFTEVVVVRHGKTACNASHIVQGQLDPELSRDGKEQAILVASRLSREAKQPAAVYSSDLRRAAETAEIIARACDVPNMVLNEALREMHMGYLQGLTWADARARNNYGGYNIFQIRDGGDPDQRRQQVPGGGESLNQLNERLVSYMNMIAREHIGERVVVVSHEAAIMELCRHTDPPDSPIVREIPNTSLNDFYISSLTGQWILDNCADVKHLEEDGRPENSSGGDGASA
ncbi:hypothetical protein BS78_05G036900 [Paspalum vaginatum]|nr:hypothetical protein BS78_05G036900 [Paspalum vaginatum]